jgi:quercetin dioxygenase-like cupin family protein
MTLLTHRGEGPSFSYAGLPVHILAGYDDQPAGFAAMEIIIPARFAGPVPHAHDDFDEAIYVQRGRLRVVGEEHLREAVAGSMFAAPRGHRHGFSNPYDDDALVLGIWAPAAPAIAFMRDIGAVLSADAPPDPELMRDVYARHASRLMP